MSGRRNRRSGWKMKRLAKRLPVPGGAQMEVVPLPASAPYLGCTCGWYMTRTKPKGGEWSEWVRVEKVCSMHTVSIADPPIEIC